MQYKVYKTVLFFLFLFCHNSIKSQVFGGDFYITYDRAKYNITAYGIDNDKAENNKTIEFTEKDIKKIKYDKLKFISFQDTSENRKKQFYETIALRLTSKKKKQTEMLIFITGKFWDVLNYTLDINFEKGTYCIFIPISQNEQLNLKKTDEIEAGTNITNLLIKM
ncbi:hypothetical protein OIU83_10685 [Flavobacterium sp. LS1R49]|uniref:Uncharacterized protein n=1 Tax=Flavobacterium shii TaxID=2987687 RepID=A0A9X3C5U4_9FLAO|nr:hypothetical protein [Flavobacterium shii]MCV9928122.1 hypothetical protein [Flavobacterium shii]